MTAGGDIRREVVELTRFLVDIPSVTGQEAAVMSALEGRLGCEGWRCRRQPVQEDRFNLWCTRGAPPRVILTTHLDTVPPFFPSREDERFVSGRGSCDAKGIAAAMIRACHLLEEAEREQLALLFVVGEETDSAGARAAASSGVRADFLIDGEPTDNQLVSGHKGVVLGRITVSGRTAHSAYPERGVSAIEGLVELLSDLKRIVWPEDGRLGQSHLNVGRIGGGEAPNVIAGEAWAESLIRTVAPAGEYRRRLQEAVGSRARLEIVKTSEPQQMLAVPGFPTRVVNFGTDIPALRPLARPLLIGPGSILEAHTAGEKIAKDELEAGVRTYAALCRRLLESRLEEFDEED